MPRLALKTNLRARRAMKPLNIEHELRFETSPLHLCELSVRVTDIAAALELPLQRWEEDGLGEAVGFAIQLPHGEAVLVQELTHAVQALGAVGPTVQVDARVLAREDLDALLGRVLDALGVPLSAVTWKQSEDGLAFARSLCDAVDAR